MKFLMAFVANDVKNIRRDPLLLYMAFIPWLIVALVRLLLSRATGWAALQQFPLESFYPLILSFFFLLQLPFMFGLIFGLLLLDEKDDRVLAAIRVTPVTLESYVAYRLVVTMLTSLIFIMITMPASGLLELSLLPGILLPALLGGLLSVMVLLLVIVLADNKVEGLAVMKGFGILMLAPMMAWFVHPKWQYLFGFFPTFWAAKALWLTMAGYTAKPYILVGVLYTGIIIFFLYSRYKKKLYFAS